MDRDKLIDFINKTLKVEPDKDPWLFNGLQVIGKNEVFKIALGVSADLELFQKAVQFGAQMIILHHGLFGPKGKVIDQVMKKRLKVLFDNEITLLTYHLFLDKDSVFGNNSQIIRLLGAKRGKQFGLMDGNYWGWEGEFSKEISINDLIQKCNNVFGAKVRVFPAGPKMIKKIAVVSGGGPSLVAEALHKNFDVFITGEAKESTQAYVKEAGINFIYPGHYNSEKFGVIALGKFIKQKFPSLDIKFIEIPNPL